MKRCIFVTENICTVYLVDSFIELLPALAKLPAGSAGEIGLERGGAGRVGEDPNGWSTISAGGASMSGVKADWAGGDSDDWFAFSAEGAGMAGGDTGVAMGLIGEAGLESGFAGRPGVDPEYWSALGPVISGDEAGWVRRDSDEWFAFSAEGAGMAGGDTGVAMGLTGEVGLESDFAGRAGLDPEGWSTFGPVISGDEAGRVRGAPDSWSGFSDGSDCMAVGASGGPAFDLKKITY